MLKRLFLLIFAVNPVLAADSVPILEAAERHAHLLAAGQNGKIQVQAGPLDASRLADCQQIESFTPPSTRSIGRTHIGVRCLAPQTWSILVPVRISVFGNYLATARGLLAGQTLKADDMQILSGDLGTLPAGVLTDPARAIGKTLRNSLGPGQILRRDQIRAPFLVRQGQRVRVLSQGEGFSVSAEGTAISDAAEGDLIGVRIGTKKRVNGIVQEDGSIHLAN